MRSADDLRILRGREIPQDSFAICPSINRLQPERTVPRQFESISAPDLQRAATGIESERRRRGLPSDGRYGWFTHEEVDIAVDSKGNTYTGENEGRRVQKWTFKGMSQNPVR